MSAAAPENPYPALYFDWLYEQVVAVRNLSSPNSYVMVCDRMHQLGFQVLVQGDDNRLSDGVILRNQFLSGITRGELNLDQVLFPDATIFEVLIGLIVRMKFLYNLDEKEMFTRFLYNLGLATYSDHHCMRRPNSLLTITRILRRFNDRKYDRSGKGGLFPLAHPDADQREIELWYQMGRFLNENNLY